MARYRMVLRSKTREVEGMQLPKEFGGTEGPAPRVHRITTTAFAARNDAVALRKARRAAKTENMLLMSVTRTVWERRIVPSG